MARDRLQFELEKVVVQKKISFSSPNDDNEAYIADTVSIIDLKLDADGLVMIAAVQISCTTCLNFRVGYCSHLWAAALEYAGEASTTFGSATILHMYMYIQPTVICYN
ncbi:hypothetical protein ACLKA7_005114 [Drosophila subpalustris]